MLSTVLSTTRLLIWYSCCRHEPTCSIAGKELILATSSLNSLLEASNRVARHATSEAKLGSVGLVKDSDTVLEELDFLLGSVRGRAESVELIHDYWNHHLAEFDDVGACLRVSCHAGANCGD